MPMPADQLGWRPDPERSGGMRWWNGLGWSDARRSADATTDRAQQTAADAVRGSTLSPQQVARTMADRAGSEAVPRAGAAGRAAASSNPFAAPAFAIGILALTLGLGGVLPVVGLIVSIAGLIRSRRRARDGSRVSGLGRSLAGLVLSLVGLVRWLPGLLVAVSGVLANLLDR